MIRKICKKATIWLLAGVIGLSAVTVQAAEVDNGASYPITTNAIDCLLYTSPSPRDCS